MRKKIIVPVSLFVMSLHLTAVSQDRLAFNESFTVLAPSNASQILACATRFRNEIAAEWGLQEDTAPATISWRPSGEDTAFTWAKSGARKYHSVYLKTGLKRATGSTLKHEVAHVVLAGRLPLWANEGLASLYDDHERRSLRSNQPSMRPIEIVNLQSVATVAEYANCERLVVVLVGVSGKKQFLNFATDCTKIGTEASLQKHYGMTFVDLSKQYSRHNR